MPLYVEPVVHLVGVVVGEVVHYEVALSLWVAGVNGVEGSEEVVAAARLGGEAKEFAATNVVRTHQTQRAVADVLEFPANRPAGLHRDVGVETLQRLNTRLLVEGDDVLGGRGLVVDPEYVIPLLAELVVRIRPVSPVADGLVGRV